jgi:hypothetical protein
MSSPARIEANRNNALRHGLTSARVVIKGESQEEFDALFAGLHAAHKPADLAEEALVQQIAANYWRLLRARRIEVGMYDSVLCEAADETAAFLANEKQFDNIRRYATSIENAYHRAIEQLRKLQRDRKQEQSLVSQKPKAVRRVVTIRPSIAGEEAISRRPPSERCLSSDPLPASPPRVQPSPRS